jgi:hypothetical protein
VITFVVAEKKIHLDLPTLKRVLKHVDGTIYTNFETYSSFEGAGIAVVNRPKTFMLNLLEHSVVDKVIQVGYEGVKCEVVRTAEELGVDVILFRRV